MILVTKNELINESSEIANEIHLISKNGFKDDIDEYMIKRGMLGVKYSYELWQVDKIPKIGKMTKNELKKHGKMMICGFRPHGWKRKYPKFNSFDE